MDKMIRILLADDHNVLRQGMAQALEAQPDMTVIAQAENGIQAINLVKKYQPDIILMDINMPQMDGVEATRQIIKAFSTIGIIILTAYRRDDYVFEAIKAGARGYLLKEVELDELTAGIRTVAQGEAVVDPAIAQRILSELRRLPAAPAKQKNKSKLTKKDVQVLRLLTEGLTNKAIADHLNITDQAVRNRFSHIFRKLHLKNRSQAVIYAFREGLVDDENK